MILNAKELSPDQKMAIESLLGRQLLASEDVSVRPLNHRPSPMSAAGRLYVVLSNISKRSMRSASGSRLKKRMPPLTKRLVPFARLISLAGEVSARR